MCASFSPPPTPTRNSGDICSNCKVFQWSQPESATLKQCSKCKVLKYCSEDCQVEHWKLVHSKHCKKLAAAKKDESEVKNASQMSVSLYSNHPFPLEGMKGDVQEALLICAQKIFEKMQGINHPAFSTIPTELKQLEHELATARASIWLLRKIGLPGVSSAVGCPSLVTRFVGRKGRKKDPLGLWPSFILFLSRFQDHATIAMMNSLKKPREAIPEELWENLDEDQIEVLISRLNALVNALGGSRFPSFEELLKIYCGGSLAQVCSFCTSPLRVAAVFGEVESSKYNMPLVLIKPCLPALFSCGASPCAEQMQKKCKEWAKWSLAVCTTRVKLEKNRCDSCFKLASRVHRSLKLLCKTEYFHIQISLGVPSA